MISTKSKLPIFYFNSRYIQTQSFIGVEAAIHKWWLQNLQLEVAELQASDFIKK